MSELKVLALLAWLVIGSITYVGLWWIGVPEVFAACAVFVLLLAYAWLLYFLDSRGVFGTSDNADE